MRAAFALFVVMLTAAPTAWVQTTETVSYIDANGQTQTVTATVLTGSESNLGSRDQTTWYVVNSNISHTGEIDCWGNVNVILADGKTMTANHSGNNSAIWGAPSSTIAIYGQTLGTGALNINGTDCNGISTNGGIVINSGTVNAILTINIYVNPRPITIAVRSATKKYDGTPLTSPYYECTVIDYDNMSNWAPILYIDSIAGLTITGSQTNVGSSANVPSNAVFSRRRDATVNMNSSYAVTYNEGTLTVTTNDTLIKVVPGSGSKIYDGTPLTKTAHEDFTVTGVPEGLTWEATADGTVTNVIPGEGEKAVNAVTSFRIFDANHMDVTAYFTNIDTTATGTLSVMLGNNVNSASWQAISTPVHDAGQSYESIDHVTNLTVPAYDLFRYDEGSSTWQNQKYSEGTATGFNRMEPGRGYIYRCGNARTLTWDGEPNSADSYSVSLTANGTSDLKGLNLVGNPYPFKVRLNRDFYALGSDGTWQKHTSGDSLEVEQGALVHTASGETLTFYATTRSTNPGKKGCLPPVPNEFVDMTSESGINGGMDDDTPMSPSREDDGAGSFVYQDDDHLVITATGTLQAFDIMGRLLFKMEIINSKSEIQKSLFPAPGVYILHLGEKMQKVVVAK